MKKSKLSESIIWLRVEGLAILITSLIFYATNDFSFLWLVLGLLIPDVSMIGYLVDNKLGAWLYNLGHSMILPLTTLLGGYRTSNNVLLIIALIWLAHIGMDRAFGYGLKTEKGFKYTTLGEIGNKA